MVAAGYMGVKSGEGFYNYTLGQRIWLSVALCVKQPGTLIYYDGLWAPLKTIFDAFLLMLKYIKLF